MVKKRLLCAAVGLAALAIAVCSYLYLRLPASAPPANLKVPMTPARIARGRYIFLLADCDGCHSQKDQTRLFAPVVDEGRGAGALIAEPSLPGRIIASNISTDLETGIGAWSDGEKIRAIREGIGKNGQALFPTMPYPYYRSMSDEDVQALVAYLNTLAPIRNSLPRTQVDFPASILMKGSPRPVTKRIPTPGMSDAIGYGEYLTTIGVCQECHTPASQGRLDQSLSYAGGRVFRFGDAQVVSTNITPDLKTGIGTWGLDYFKERFYKHNDYGPGGLPAASPDRFTIMPWLNLAQLTSEDLEAIYRYLRTLPPIQNRVQFTRINVRESAIR